MNLSDELDRSFGSGPTLHSPDPVVAGRRALRRRRTSTALGGFAVVAVLGIGASVLSPTTTDDPARPAAGPNAAASEKPDDPVPSDQASLEAAEVDAGPVAPVRLDGGRLVAGPGWTVLESLRNPGYSENPALRDTWAYTLQAPGGATSHYLASFDQRGLPRSSVSYRTGGEDSLAAFVLSAARGTDPGERVTTPGRSLTHLDPSGTGFVPLPGTTLVAESSDVPAGLAPRGAAAAVATVELGITGETWYVLATREPGKPTSYSYGLRGQDASSVEQFLTRANQKAPRP